MGRRSRCTQKSRHHISLMVTWLFYLQCQRSRGHQHCGRSLMPSEMDGDDPKGTIVGNVLHFVATDNRGNTTEVDARFVGDKVTGHMSTTFSNAPKEHMKHSFSGYALKERPAGPARTIEFKPAEFHN